MSGHYTGLVEKAWEHRKEDGETLVCFTLKDVSDHAFIGGDDWLPLLEGAIELGTKVGFLYETQEVVSCADPMCGDGCCDDPECTNVPEEERSSYLLRADSIQWL